MPRAKTHHTYALIREDGTYRTLELTKEDHAALVEAVLNESKWVNLPKAEVVIRVGGTNPLIEVIKQKPEPKTHGNPPMSQLETWYAKGNDDEADEDAGPPEELEVSYDSQVVN